MQETGKEINPSYAASVWQVLFFPDLSGFYFFCIIYTYMPKRNEGVHNKQTLIL
jgi:hypothetical protein